MVDVLDPGRYFGALVRSWEGGAFSLRITRYGGEERVPAHAHKRPYLCFVLQGGYREHSGVLDRACDEGTLVVHAGGARHSDRFDASGAVCLNVSWNGDGGALLLRRIGRAVPVGSWRSPGLRDLGVRLADLASGRRVPAESSVERQVCAVAEEAAVARDHASSPDEPEWLERAEESLRDDGPSVRELARIAGVHRTTLLRAFWRHRGSSVRAAIRRRRLDRAIEGLLHSRTPLAELAQRAGFADQSHLCRALRAAMGTSPSRVRGRASCVQEPADDGA